MHCFSTRRVEFAGVQQSLEGVVVQRQRGFQQVLAQLRQVGDPRGVGAGAERQAGLELFQRHGFPRAVLVVGGPEVAHAGDQVGHADELVAAAQRHLAQQRVGAQALADALHAMREAGADAIHLVDVADPRHLVLVGQAPVGLGLRLHPGDAVEHHHGAVEHAQRTGHLDGEVDVSRRVDHVDLVALPLGGHRRRLDRDAALALLLHVVGGGRALAFLGVVHVDDLVLAPGVIEDAFGGRGLARVDVRDDADVAVERKGFLAGHGRDSGEGLHKRSQVTAQMLSFADFFNEGLPSRACLRGRGADAVPGADQGSPFGRHLCARLPEAGRTSRKRRLTSTEGPHRTRRTVPSGARSGFPVSTIRSMAMLPGRRDRRPGGSRAGSR